MSSHPEASTLIHLIELLGQIKTGAELIAWVEQDLQPVFAHGAFVCGMGKIRDTGVSPIKFFSSNFPVDYLRALKRQDGVYFSAVIQNWLKTGEAQLLDCTALAGTNLDSGWLQGFQASGLQNIAAHGVCDYSRQHASYFSFHQIPEPLDTHHRRLLNLLVPHLHVTLLRIMHTLKSNTRSTASPGNRSLTGRELEVLSWVCEGKTSAEIASILSLSASTVRNQIQSILVKLRVSTRSQAAAKAIRKGLVVSRQPDSILGHF